LGGEICSFTEIKIHILAAMAATILKAGKSSTFMHELCTHAKMIHCFCYENGNNKG